MHLLAYIFIEHLLKQFCLWIFRGFANKSDEGWLSSMFAHKVDARKDAHSNLLSKKETSNLYKIQCEPIHLKPSRMRSNVQALGEIVHEI